MKHYKFIKEYYKPINCMHLGNYIISIVECDCRKKESHTDESRYKKYIKTHYQDFTEQEKLLADGKKEEYIHIINNNLTSNI